jgi:hypothetical protein
VPRAASWAAGPRRAARAGGERGLQAGQGGLLLVAQGLVIGGGLERGRHGVAAERGGRGGQLALPAREVDQVAGRALDADLQLDERWAFSRSSEAVWASRVSIACRVWLDRRSMRARWAAGLWAMSSISLWLKMAASTSTCEPSSSALSGLPCGVGDRRGLVGGPPDVVDEALLALELQLDAAGRPEVGGEQVLDPLVGLPGRRRAGLRGPVEGVAHELEDRGLAAATPPDHAAQTVSELNVELVEETAVDAQTPKLVMTHAGTLGRARGSVQGARDP